MNFDPSDVPLHVALSEACSDPRERPAVPGESVRLKGKLHDFGALIPYYGSVFTSKLLDAFARVYALDTASTTVRRALQLRRFLCWLAVAAMEADATEAAVACVYSALLHGRHDEITREEMSDAVEAFASRVRNTADRSIVSTANKLTRQHILESLSSVFQGLAGEGLWPNIGIVKGLRDRSKARDNIPALGELTRSHEVQSEIKAPADSYLAMRDRSRTRLLRLREHFENALLEEEAAFDRRRAITERRGLPSIQNIRTAVSELTGDYDRPSRIAPQTVLAEACFPLGDREKRLSSLLRIIEADYGGAFRLQQLPFGLQRVVATCGGTAAVMRHLEGGPRALTAAYGLVLIDTGLNIQPVDDLSSEPFIGTMKQGKVRLRIVGSTKNRSNYKPVDGVIKEPEDEVRVELAYTVKGARISAARAIEIWLKLSEPMRKRALNAGRDCANKLWIIRRGNSPIDVRRYEHHSFKTWWTDLLAEAKDDPIIGGLLIQRRMIRTTVLQLHEAEHDGDAELVALLADHSTARTTTRHYLNRTHIRRMLDEKIREFQKLFEASIAGESPNRALQLGLTQTEFALRRERAVETGIGFLCHDPFAGTQPGTDGSICTKLECCAECPMMRFVPSLKSLEALVVFRRSLEEAQGYFISRNIQRWTRVWLPALAMCLAIEELLCSGPKKHLLQRAMQAAEEGLASGRHCLVRIW